jgi:dUTPase
MRRLASVLATEPSTYDQDIEVQELPGSGRGTDGFGSTGRT